MSSGASVRGYKVTATGDITSAPCRVSTIMVVQLATPGTGDIVLRDGGASGTVLATIPVPGVQGMFPIPIEESYIRATSKLHCSAIPTNTNLVVFLDPPF